MQSPRGPVLDRNKVHFCSANDNRHGGRALDRQACRKQEQVLLVCRVKIRQSFLRQLLLLLKPVDQRPELLLPQLKETSRGNVPQRIFDASLTTAQRLQTDRHLDAASVGRSEALKLSLDLLALLAVKLFVRARQ